MASDNHRSMAMEEACDGDKMLDVYVYDFLKKRNFEESAKAFLKESRLPTHSAFVAIDVPDGFLLEWWTVFWDLFKVRSGLPHSEMAASYMESQQTKLREQQLQQQQQQQQQQILRIQKGQLLGVPDAFNSNVVTNPRMSLELRASDDALLRQPAYLSAETLSDGKSLPCSLEPADSVSMKDVPLLQNGSADNIGRSSTFLHPNADSLYVESIPTGGDQQRTVPLGSPGLMNKGGDTSLLRQQVQLKGSNGWPLVTGGGITRQMVSSQGIEHLGQSFAQHPQTQRMSSAQMQQQEMYVGLQNQAGGFQPMSMGNGLNFCERDSSPSNGGHDVTLSQRMQQSNIAPPQQQQAQQQDRLSGVGETDKIGKKRKESSNSSQHPADRIFRLDNSSSNSDPGTLPELAGSSRARQQAHSQIAGLSMGSPSITHQTAITSGELNGEHAADFGVQVDSSLPMLNESVSMITKALVGDPGTVSAQKSSTPKFSFREVGCLRASTSKVLSCHFSSDGNLLASAGHDKKLSLWNMTSLNLQHTLEEHSLLITDVRFSPSFTHLATSSYDKTVRVWEVRNPTCSVRTFYGHATSVLALDFHPNHEDLLCSCDGDSEIRYWSVSRGTCLKIFKGGVTQLRFQPRVGRFLAAGAENVVTIFDVESDTSVYGLLNHSKPVNNLCWSASGDVLVSLTEDYVRVWSFGTRNVAAGTESWSNCIHELGFKEKMYQSCVFHPTYPSLLVIGCYQSMELWNMVENKIMTVSAHDGLIVSLAACPVTGLVASASHDKTVKLWQ